jgi:hypothetical protein
VAIGLVAAMVAVTAGAWTIAAKDEIPSRLPPALLALGRTTYEYAGEYREGVCFLRPAQSAFAAGCAPSAGSGPLIVLWGDSHAAHLYPGLRTLAAAHGFRLAQYNASACPPVIGLDAEERPFCKGINDEVIATIERLRPDVVVMSARWFGYRNVMGALDGLAATIDAVKQRGVRRVILVGPVPLWRDTPARLVFDAYSSNRLAGVARMAARGPHRRCPPERRRPPRIRGTSGRELCVGARRVLHGRRLPTLRGRRRRVGLHRVGCEPLDESGVDSARPRHR